MRKKRPTHSAARYGLRHDGRVVDVVVGEFVIGRGSECQLQLRDALVSRRHARLSVGEDDLYIEDLGSRNGVLVNTRRIIGVMPIKHGDTVVIGLASLEVVDDFVLHRLEQLSTMPPPTRPEERPRVPLGEADVDMPDVETIAARIDALTEREREVLRLLVLGHTQKEIAKRLELSVKTVETHRAHIAEKLGCHTRAELVAYGITAGVLGHGNLGRVDSTGIRKI
jgi:DNA-binding CsgD family transcriptional regulator